MGTIKRLLCKKEGIELNNFGDLSIYEITEVPIDGDVFYNPFFGDFWVVKDSQFVKINDGYITDIDDTIGFIKVGHVDFSLIYGQQSD